MLVPNTKKAWDEVDNFKVRSEDWRYRSVQIGSMFSFFSYAETQVIDCEQAFVKFYGEYKPAKFVSCAIAAYGHMKASLRFASKLAKSIDLDISKFASWEDDLTRKRDRISAHPDVYRYTGTKIDIPTINVHEGVIYGPDKISFPLWHKNIKKAEDRITVILTPRTDLNKVAELLELISENVLRIYQAELAVRT